MEREKQLQTAIERAITLGGIGRDRSFHHHPAKTASSLKSISFPSSQKPDLCSMIVVQYSLQPVSIDMFLAASSSHQSEAATSA